MRLGSLLGSVLCLTAAGSAAERPDSWNDFRWTEVNPLFDVLAHSTTPPGPWTAAGLNPIDPLEFHPKAAGTDHPAQLTRDEQMAVLTLAHLAGAPRPVRTDPPKGDDWTQTLFSNPEALAIDQDRAAKPLRRIAQRGTGEVWAKSLADGDLALGFFNRSEQPATVAVFWPEAGLTGPCWVRDVWNLQDRPEADRGLEVSVASHGAVLVKLHPLPPKVDAEK